MKILDSKGSSYYNSAKDYHTQTSSYNSDVGWGCLVRVGQMALASALVNYFDLDYQERNYQLANTNL